MDTAGAAEELSTASEYQRKAGRRAACLGLILIIVAAVVLIAVGSFITVTASTSALTYTSLPPPDFIIAVGDCGRVYGHLLLW